MPKTPNNSDYHLLAVTGIVHKEQSDAYFYRYEGKALDGGKKALLVSRDALKSEVDRQLKRQGFCRTECERPADGALPLLIEVAQFGWRPDRSGFVSFHGIVGCAKNLLPPSGLTTRVPGSLRQSGSLRGFGTKIAPIAKRSSTLMLALCSGFGSPLLSLLGAQPFGFVLYGPSRAGKSTAQVLCASILGAGGPKDLCNLTATSNGLLETAMLFNDHTFVIDELGTAEGTKRDVYSAIFDATYRILGGRDKRRHSTFDRDVGYDPNQTSNFILLLSSEHSPDEWAARAGESRDEGEKARLIGVPVIEEGWSTIFDRPPKSCATDKRQRRKWERKAFRRLARRFPKYRGQAFPAYLDYLMKDVTAATIAARAYSRQFEGEARPLAKSAIDEQIISNFGLVYAGGAIACDAAILPFSKGLVMKMILARCRTALASMPRPEDILRTNLAQLRRQIRKQIFGRQWPIGKLKEAPGYRLSKQSADVVVRAKAFSEWFATPRDRNIVLQWLDAKGFLKGACTGKKRPKDMGWAESQPTWPDRTRPRSIQICLPTGLSDLRL